MLLFAASLCTSWRWEDIHSSVCFFIVFTGGGTKVFAPPCGMQRCSSSPGTGRWRAEWWKNQRKWSVRVATWTDLRSAPCVALSMKLWCYSSPGGVMENCTSSSYNLECWEFFCFSFLSFWELLLTFSLCNCCRWCTTTVRFLHLSVPQTGPESSSMVVDQINSILQQFWHHNSPSVCSSAWIKTFLHHGTEILPWFSAVCRKAEQKDKVNFFCCSCKKHQLDSDFKQL